MNTDCITVPIGVVQHGDVKVMTENIMTQQPFKRNSRIPILFLFTMRSFFCIYTLHMYTDSYLLVHRHKQTCTCISNRYQYIMFSNCSYNTEKGGFSGILILRYKAQLGIREPGMPNTFYTCM